MTSNADLVAKLRRAHRMSVSDVTDPNARTLWGDAAVALEAADQRAEEAEAAEKRWEDRAYAYSTERNQLAAVVEKVRVRLTTDLDANDESHVSDALTILDSAPADALREVKADVWDEGYGVCDSCNLFGPIHGHTNPYRAREEQSR